MHSIPWKYINFVSYFTAACVTEVSINNKTDAQAVSAPMLTKFTDAYMRHPAAYVTRYISLQLTHHKRLFIATLNTN